MSDHLEKHELFEANFSIIYDLKDNNFACNLYHIKYYSIIQLIFHILIDTSGKFKSRDEIRNDYFRRKSKGKEKDESGYHVHLQRLVRELLEEENKTYKSITNFKHNFSIIKTLRTKSDYYDTTLIGTNIEDNILVFDKVLEILNELNDE